MLYRRAPRNPPTLLLRIVAAAGAGTVLGMAACGGETGAPGLLPVGSAPLTATSDAQADDGSAPLGAIDMPEDAGTQPFMGFVYNPDAAVLHGLVHHPEDAGSEDAGTDAQPMGVITGVVVNPHDAGHDSGSTHTCPPLCGVVIGVVPNH